MRGLSSAASWPASASSTPDQTAHPGRRRTVRGAGERAARPRQGLIPRLPFKTADILLIDEMGKNISGTGMDTNVIGRKYNDHAAVEETPKSSSSSSAADGGDARRHRHWHGKFCRTRLVDDGQEDHANQLPDRRPSRHDPARLPRPRNPRRRLPHHRPHRAPDG